MADADYARSTARAVVLTFAVFLIPVDVLLSLVMAGFSQMCEDGSTPAMVADCYRGLVGMLVGAAISVALAIGATVLVTKARTAAVAWTGGGGLLVAAILLSPVVGLLNG